MKPSRIIIIYAIIIAIITRNPIASILLAPVAFIFINLIIYPFFEGEGNLPNNEKENK